MNRHSRFGDITQSIKGPVNKIMLSCVNIANLGHLESIKKCFYYNSKKNNSKYFDILKYLLYNSFRLFSNIHSKKSGIVLPRLLCHVPNRVLPLVNTGFFSAHLEPELLCRCVKPPYSNTGARNTNKSL